MSMANRRNIFAPGFDAQGDHELYCNGKWTRQKQQLSSDQVALYRYRAERKIPPDSLTPSARAGSSARGRWNAAAHTSADLREGQTVTPDLDSRATAHVNAARATLPRSEHCTAGEAPEGSSQLLLVANETSALAADGKNF